MVAVIFFKENLLISGCVLKDPEIPFHSFHSWKCLNAHTLCANLGLGKGSGQGSRICGTFSDPELTQNHFLRKRRLRKRERKKEREIEQERGRENEKESERKTKRAREREREKKKENERKRVRERKKEREIE